MQDLVQQDLRLSQKCHLYYIQCPAVVNSSNNSIYYSNYRRKHSKASNLKQRYNSADI